MDRRESLKLLALGSVSAGLFIEACKQQSPSQTATHIPASLKAWDENSGRQPFEVERDEKLASEKFFTDHEMKTIAILADIIIPADEHSGSATDAGVPDFIEFIVKDMPHLQTPMRGGLRWLDYQCMQRYGKDFASCSPNEQMEMVDEIAWPNKAKPEMAPGVAFFNLMRNLTATGFFTSEMGIKDLGYMGNQPNFWDGVPEDVLQQFGLSYDPNIPYIKADERGKIMTWS
ncbi:MAG: gluconate 2-dehydrogenase subunit 3 family protein [Thermoflavifilum sp.]|nr:gluconate 2-dehydrogenase subunit 3 family protein [Thermoflavifilum sp.]